MQVLQAMDIAILVHHGQRIESRPHLAAAG